MTTKQLDLWKSEAVQITEQVHEWRALPPLLLPQLSFSVFLCFRFAMQNLNSSVIVVAVVVY